MRGRVYLRGTKSETSDRWLNLPDWLVKQLAARAADEGAEGYVFAAPAQRDPRAGVGSEQQRGSGCTPSYW